MGEVLNARPGLYGCHVGRARARARSQTNSMRASGLCVMMAATGVLSLGEATFSLKPSHISEFFVALYVLLFAAVWFLFEISQIRPIAAVHDLLRRNFGFLFSPIGKCSFIVFIAFLNFGVADQAMALWTGILVCADGIIAGLIYLKYPAYYPRLEDPSQPEPGYSAAAQLPPPQLDLRH